jgi:SAM-dependent methyltransferase
MAGMVRKIGNLMVRLVTSPRQTIKSIPDLAESARMRLAKDSTFRRKQDVLHSASQCPAAMIDRILNLWNPASVLDVGCGPGVVLDYLLERGLTDLQGLEGSAVAIEAAKHPELIQRVDLAAFVDLKRRFDMVYSVEVAEHLRRDVADIFVDTCVRHGDRILFTAAHPGQGGLGHLNEQLPEYWIEKFRTRGFAYDEKLVSELRPLKNEYPENLMVFQRG